MLLPQLKCLLVVLNVTLKAIKKIILKVLICEKRIILFYIVHNLMDVYLCYFWITPYMLNYQRFAIWDERNRELNAL